MSHEEKMNEIDWLMEIAAQAFLDGDLDRGFNHYDRALDLLG